MRCERRTVARAAPYRRPDPFERGDFVTATGRPHRNVYVFRFDWRGGQLVAGVEYLNPMTICWSFDLPLCTPPAAPPT